ncbi:hypothetical protein ACOKM5_44080 [Streptomyces sp. BH097]|uniref:hypothetical protein n=1 Tax=unclassified Streptomyces TaxID=2593676 RepID=UPI003BB75CC4
MNSTPDENAVEEDPYVPHPNVAGLSEEELFDKFGVAKSALMGAMHGISDAYRELGSGTGRGYGPMAEFRENNLNTQRPVADLAGQLAHRAVDIVVLAGALDAYTAELRRRGLISKLED